MSRKSETWLPVVGFEGRYSVSDLGNVMSMNYRGTGMMRLLVPAATWDGYVRVCLLKDGKQVSKRIHSLVMAAFVGPRPSKHDINHKSGVKTDNSLSNLEYCSSSQNRLHAYKIGAQVPMCGEAHPSAKLNEEKVRDVKRRLAAGETRASIARLHGVGASSITLIAQGKRWRSLQ